MLHIPDEHPLVKKSEQKLTIPLRTIGKNKINNPVIKKVLLLKT